ncbi:MAG: PAC2 family protein [Chloroflexi bacterium]|nr:PAC2 family protein [Chloroflexota bacterium]
MRIGEFDIAEPIPELKDPHMLVVLRPWIDVGNVGSLSLGRIERHLRSKELGRLHRPGRFYDFTRYRPRSYLVSGNREVTIPNTIIRYSNPEDGPHLLTAHLLEPHLYGEDYADALLEIIEYFGVKLYALIGGMYDMVPHTRPLVVSGLGSGENVERDYNIANARPSNYEGPTTITYTITETATKMGLETRAFVVHLPQYLNLDDDYRGAARMMDVLCRLYNFPEYIAQTDRGQKQYDELTDNDGQIPSGDTLTRIEEMYDSEYGEGSGPEPSTPLPSSIEEFLQGLDVNLNATDGDDAGDDTEPGSSRT